MVMKVLLFGSNGQVGSACCEQLPKVIDHLELIRLTRADADFGSPEAVVLAFKKYQPDFVVNACAYTAVDKAETEVELVYTVNSKSVGALAKACAEQGVPLLHISTDYVFSGQASDPYKETDLVEPTGVYGISKLSGEQQVVAAQGPYIILRTSWVFGDKGNNFVKTMLRLATARSELGVVSDQLGCPTYAGDIAKVIAQLISQYVEQGSLPWGLYHCSNSGSCSWFEFANTIFDLAVEYNLLDKKPTLNSITTAQFPTPVQRPAYSVMSCKKLEALIGELPHWRKGLEIMLLSMKGTS